MPKTTKPKRVKQEIVLLDWHNKYDKSWNGLLVPDAFQHPAKISFALAEAIYDFAIEQGMLHQGDAIVDPFAGIAGTALSALLRGMKWTGIELESKFVALGNADIELWNARFGLLPKWGSASIVQGDSRNLAQIVSAADTAISSPPYAGTFNETQHTVSGIAPRDTAFAKNFVGGYGATAGNLGNLREGDFDAAVSSPPYSNEKTLLGFGEKSDQFWENNAQKHGRHIGKSASGVQREYGNTDGQLGAMKEGNFDAAVSSPPYSEQYRPASDQEIAINLNKKKPKGGGKFKKYDGSQSAGNLASLDMMKEGEFDAAVSSPPYEGSLTAGGHLVWQNQGKMHAHKDSMGKEEIYGTDSRQLGNESGETFWEASRQIVAQLYQVLKADGYAFFVVKDFVRAKKIVPFCEQWMKLCESVGFETTHWIRAWQVKELGTQLAFDGNHQTKRVERKSFFRRLHEKKNPSTRIDYEVIIVMRKA